MIMDIKRSINDTRKGFEESFSVGEFYNRQTQDSDHLEKILGFVKISERMKIFPKSIDIDEYLRSSAVIDYMNESVSGLADS